MIFWAGVLAGVITTWLAIKKGFYETLVMLFNIVISVYVSIFLTPVIVKLFPAANDTPYGNALTLTVIAIGTFMALYGVAYVFLTGQFKVKFPKIFDVLFTGLFGFFIGFLILSFAAFVITVTPISQNRFISQIGFNKKSQQTNISFICRWCDLVNKVAASPDENITCESIMDELIKSAEQKEPDNTNEPAEPNDTITDDIGENSST
jgi:uncharacterized membrane protein required for colicin V production